MVVEASRVKNPLHLEFHMRHPFLHWVSPLVTSGIRKVTKLDRINRLYDEIPPRLDPGPFLREALAALRITHRVSERDLNRIPREGPVIVVSNHPFGAIDGIILNCILLSARSDVRVMANYILSRIPELQDVILSVDPFERKGSVRANIKPLRQAIRHVRDGGMISIFPAGEVSHLHLRKRKVEDPDWGPFVARLVRKTRAAVLPVFFHGHNSRLFHLAGLVHPALRTVMLPREMLKMMNRTIRLRIGNPVPYRRFIKITGDRDRMDYLRLRTYILGEHPKRVRMIRPFPGKRTVRSPQPIVGPQNRAPLWEEIRALGRDRQLSEAGDFSVYYAEAHQIPHLLQEIGRLREITFREEGEGTGKPADIDGFDAYYGHLFLWNHRKHELVGAYRFGLTDLVLPKYGQKGLYTNTLFDYGTAFLNRIHPAMELGRSFVRREYQKSYQPLMLLWKGIAGFIAGHPQYRVLFGPVSITKEYRALSRHLMVSFLETYNRVADLAPLVKPRNPLKRRRLQRHEIRSATTLLQDIQGLSELVTEIEGDERGVPILIKQYLKLGGKILGFNVDPEFSDVLDALIVVDLLQTDQRILERYFGKDETADFLQYHEAGSLAINA